MVQTKSKGGISVTGSDIISVKMALFPQKSISDSCLPGPNFDLPGPGLSLLGPSLTFPGPGYGLLGPRSGLPGPKLGLLGLA